jgi:peptide/nickel transport system permease protein
VVARRLVLAVPLLVVVSALTFLLVSLTPGNVADEILGYTGTPAQYRALDRALGLNLPVYDQYWQWLRHALNGNFGTSILSDQPVTELIRQRLPVTLSLVIGALLVSATLGVGLGVISAVRGGALGRGVDAFAQLGFALPAYWLAAEMIVLFAVDLKLFPVAGYVPTAQSMSGWFRSLVLPVVALSLYGVAAIAKQTRESMLDALASPYIWSARANGLRSRSVVLRHALRNASVNIVTVIGIQAVGLLIGTVFVENVFALPGLGSLVVTSATGHDLPVVQAIAVFVTVLVVLINIAVDIAYTWLNPRVNLE